MCYTKWIRKIHDFTQLLKICFFCIDSMQFMSSSLDALVKNLTDNGFKYLSQEYRGDFLKLVK